MPKIGRKMMALCPLLLPAVAGSSDIALATFDGAAGTSFNFVELNDPVMGGQSTGTWALNSAGHFGAFDGEVVDVPSLKAPGFIKTAADGHFTDVSAAAQGELVLVVRSSTPEYQGFRVSFASGTMAPSYACSGGGSIPLSRGCFKAKFSVPAGENFAEVRIPLKSFSDKWSPSTGEQTTTCAQDSSVCPTAKRLAAIKRLEVWAEGALGKVHLEVKSISVGVSARPLTVVPATNNTCKGTIQKKLRYGISGRTEATVPVPVDPSEDLAQAVCCDARTKVFAEPQFLYQAPDIALFDKLTGLTTFYDSACGIPLFRAPVNRTMAEFQADTDEHGWPSFRKEEVVAENVKVDEHGFVYSSCGTHLGSFLPDDKGARWCMDLSCIAGNPPQESALIIFFHDVHLCTLRLLFFVLVCGFEELLLPSNGYGLPLVQMCRLGVRSFVAPPRGMRGVYAFALVQLGAYESQPLRLQTAAWPRQSGAADSHLGQSGLCGLWSSTNSFFPPFGASAAGLGALAGLLGAGRSGHRRLFAAERRKRGPKKLQEVATCLTCVVEGDMHAASVRRWLDMFVIKENFCPWAKPARDRGSIRVVTSSATEPQGVLQDLLREAEMLPEKVEGEAGQATTTLLVCPHVEEWVDFDQFYIFFSEQLDAGNALVEQFGMKVVAFHPNYSLYGLSVQVGDRVAVAGPDGTTVPGTVIAEDAGINPEDGEPLIEVRFDDGEEFLVRYSSIMGSMQEGDERPNDGSSDSANLVSRAPRPTLHLLRIEDLDRAGAAGVLGAGPAVEAVLERNAERAAEIGFEGMEDILERCG
ncbi:unnamed protein product [Polarella glacialis]|uniref:NADH:ubiquinone oxidoreductase intermediate-associated protein 30 domain-containing protein n=2 Tax=Polarella glacialis TaxID=89957 RepID=A0A813H3X6_POLGL|nr:unnamed protein product [Polarella glacialis]